MKLNQDKCHLIVTGHKFENLFAQIGEAKIWETCKQKLLGVLIDRNRKVDEYVSSLCDKPRQKFLILIRLSNFMGLYHKRILMKAFIESQFGYSPLIWMVCSRKNNIRINFIHERASRAIYKDNFSSFENLLKKDLKRFLFIIEIFNSQPLDYLKLKTVI